MRRRPPPYQNDCYPTAWSVNMGHTMTMTTRSDGLVIPEGGFQPAPVIPQPNIFPMEWRVEREKFVENYERAKLQVWNPYDLPWDDLHPEDYTPAQRIGMLYWLA